MAVRELFVSVRGVDPRGRGIIVVVLAANVRAAKRNALSTLTTSVNTCDERCEGTRRESHRS